MKEIEQIKIELSNFLPQLKKDYNIAEIGLFGSYLRKEQGQKSDLDILVAFEKKPSLFRFIELENYLSDKLGVKVDLVIKSALKPAIAEQILNEAAML